MTIKGNELLDLLDMINDKDFSKDILEVLDEVLDEYEIKTPQSVWQLRESDTCWRVFAHNGKFEVTELKRSQFNEDYRLMGLIHLTEGRAEHHARVLNTELDIKKWKKENDNIELDWEDDKQLKYHLMYNYKDGEILVCWRVLKFSNTVYFSSREIAEQCFEDISRKRIIEWLKWEDNDQ